MTQDDQRGAAGDGRSEPAGPGTPPTPAAGPDGPTDPRGVPAYQPPPGDVSGAPGPAVRPGRIRHQDEHTRPREPTLAERRARDQARRRAIEEQIAAAQAADTKRKRRRILVGTGVTVGIVAVIALAYAVSDDDEVEARCVDENNVVVDDANCATPVASGSDTHYHGGGIYPIFIGAGGRQYHYNYGGSGTIGQPVSGGTTSVPKSSTKVTSGTSGKTLSGGSSYSYSGGSSSSSSGSDSVKRGGLGVSGGGSKSSGSSGS
ncbi:MAG: hypothetical protein AB7J32_06365 [Pseudonocardia sp.]